MAFSLEKLLDGLDIAVEPFAVCEVRGNGRLDLGRREHASLHYTLAGHGRLYVGDGPEIPVAAATLLIVPAHQSHRLEAADRPPAANAPLPACAPLGKGWRRVVEGVGDSGVLMACGSLHVTYHDSAGLFDFLREPIAHSLAGEDTIRRSLDLMLAELADPRPGTRALVRALMQQCLVLLLRQYFGTGSRAPWLAALEDPRLGAAVNAILDRPEAPHTLDHLADLAGMSRSSFAEHFAASFGRGPMDMLREIRLRRAARLLRATDQPIKRIAAGIGYDSRSYFSRAFKELYGISPADYRVAGE